MTPETLLLRQIHPSFVQGGRVTSQAFKPTPKDRKKLSVYNGDLIAPAEAYEHYREELGFLSSGVRAVNVRECRERGLEPADDPEPFPEHAVIDFAPLSDNEIKKAAKVLAKAAERRGWLFRPPDQ